MLDKQESRVDETLDDASRPRRILWIEAAGWMTLSIILPGFLGQFAVVILHYGFNMRGNLLALVFWIPLLLGAVVGLYIARAVLKAGPVKRNRRE